MTRAKLVALLSMLAAIPAAVLLLGSAAPATGPEAIRYGRDACDRCRMHFASKGYAAERRDESGALRKYDDIGCMLVAASHSASGDIWVEDHGDGGFVLLSAATLVAGDGLGTPMNYGVVAFRDPARAAAFAASQGARVVALEQLLKRRFGAEDHR